jgi:hypothetical protein
MFDSVKIGFGADPIRFRDLVEEQKLLPRSRADRCSQEFERARSAAIKLFGSEPFKKIRNSR